MCDGKGKGWQAQRRRQKEPRRHGHGLRHVRHVRQGDRRPSSEARGQAGDGGKGGKAKGGCAAAVLLRQVRGGGRTRASAGRAGAARPDDLAEEEEEDGPGEAAMTDPEQVHAERMGGMVSGTVGEIMVHHGIGAGRGHGAPRDLADMDPALLALMWYDANDDFMATIDALIRKWGHASRELQVRTSAARGEQWGVQRARDIEAYMDSRGGGRGARGRLAE